MRQRIKKFIKKDSYLYRLLKKNSDLLEKLMLPLIDNYIYFQEIYYHYNAKYSNKTGVLEDKKRDVPVIVSLTTIPERLDRVYLCIETLLKQSLKPDKIILWLSDTIHEKDIPATLKRLEKRGLQIRSCKDIRSYTKIVHALREETQSIIVTADDDVLYPRHWLKKLYEAHRKEPWYVYCHRAHLIEKSADGKLKYYHEWSWCSPGVKGPSHRLFPTGVGGVLYPPGSLHAEVLNHELFMRICPTADDVWLKAMSLLNGVACKKVASRSMRIYNIRGVQEKNLWSINTDRNDTVTRNDQQIQAVFTHYDLYRLL